jgi:hypothetical protein
MKQQASRDAKDREEYHRHCIHVERSLQQHRDWLLEHDRRFLDQPTTTHRREYSSGGGGDREEQEDVLEQMYQHLKQKLATAFQEFSSTTTTMTMTMTMNHINTDQRRQRVTSANIVAVLVGDVRRSE